MSTAFALFFMLAMMFWSIISLILMATSGSNMYDFLRSMNFIIVAVGYVIIFAMWPIVKRMDRGDYYE